MKTLTSLDDRQLVLSYRNGESNALEQLVYRHKSKLFNYIYLQVKNKEAAEDIFQDTFCKIIDCLRNGRYNEEGKFIQWAMRIAQNLCIDHFRKQKTTPVVRISFDKETFEGLALADGGADINIIRNQTYGKVRTMLDMLPPEQKEIIIMRHYADLKFKEIASLLHCSLNTALGRMRYGLINLRKMMEVQSATG